ncbi:MAG TPA: hypothetical protein IAC28_02445 [Candidatus Aphodovivens excrementavium]|nr:hypothetical protein [Candidatus Aphodovivens excrementavium]
MKLGSRVLKGWQGFGIKATAVLLTCFLATQMLGVPSVARAQDADEEAIATEVEDTKATTDALGAESTPEEEASSATQEPEASESSAEDATEVEEGTETTETTEGTESTTGTEDADASGSADSVATLSDDQGDEAGEQESADIELSAHSASAQLTSAKTARSDTSLCSEMTGTASIEGAEVAYVYYTNGDSSNPEFVTVNNGDSLHIECFAAAVGHNHSVVPWDWDWRDAHDGYIVFFVKPENNYLVTGLNASGDGNLYSLETAASSLGYPGIESLISQAYRLGYVAAFGYSRTFGNQAFADFDASFTVNGYQPEIEVSATVDKTQNVVPGDELTLDVTIKPQATTTDGRSLSIEDVRVNSLTINGVKHDVSNVISNGDGTYSCTVAHEATKEDCAAKKIEFTVEAAVDYRYSFAGDDSTITSEATITGTDTVTCQIAPMKGVTYRYAQEDLPEAVKDTLPTDDAQYYPGQTVTVKDPTVTKVEIKGEGYYTFDGWTFNGEPVEVTTVKMPQSGLLELVGSWTYTPYVNINESTDFVVTIDEQTIYNGTSQMPEVKVEYEGAILEEGKDYTVSLSRDDQSVDEAVNAGTYQVAITGIESAGFTGTKTVDYTINPATLTVTPDSGQSKTYGDPDPAELTYTVSGAQNGETPAFTGELARAAGETAGEYAITQGTLALADSEGDFLAANYKLEVAAGVKFTIEPANLEPDPEDPSKNEVFYIDTESLTDVTYDGTEQKKEPVVKYVEGDAVVSSADYEVTYDGDATNVTDEGLTVKVTFTQGNYEGTELSYTYKINPATLTVQASDASKTEGEADPELTYTVGAAQNNETPAFTGELARATGEKAGEYVISMGTLALDDNGSFLASNYVIDFTEATFVINAAPVDPDDPDDPDNPNVDPDDPNGTTDDDPNGSGDGDNSDNGNGTNNGGGNGNGGGTNNGMTTGGNGGNGGSGAGAGTTTGAGAGGAVAAAATTGADATAADADAADGADATDEEAIDDDATPMASTSSIEDDATPMAAGHTHSATCWVHWLILVGIAATVVYYIAVIVRRKQQADNAGNMR